MTTTCTTLPLPLHVLDVPRSLALDHLLAAAARLAETQFAAAAGVLDDPRPAMLLVEGRDRTLGGDLTDALAADTELTLRVFLPMLARQEQARRVALVVPVTLGTGEDVVAAIAIGHGTTATWVAGVDPGADGAEPGLLPWEGVRKVPAALRELVEALAA